MKTPPDLHAFENRLFDEWQRRSLRCGDGGEIAYDGLLYRGAFAYDSGYWSRLPDLRRINDWIYRSPSTRQTLINSYHPSYRGMTHRDLYTSLLTAYHSAL